MEESLIQNPASDTEIEAQKELNDTQFVQSRFNFLSNHNGIRPNTLHGLMANTGIGKSTLMKCIIIELAKVMKVLVWLSEEDRTEYQMLINKMDRSVLKNIVFIQERDIPEKYRQNQAAFFTKFIEIVVESGCQIVVPDNITTSPFYNSQFGFVGQTKTTAFLISFVKQYCSIFYIAHTDKSVKTNLNRMLTPEDIRGAKDFRVRRIIKTRSGC